MYNQAEVYPFILCKHDNNKAKKVYRLWNILMWGIFQRIHKYDMKKIFFSIITRFE